MPHKRARVEDQRARDAAHEARRAPVVITDHTPEAALLSLEVLWGVPLLLPRDFLKQALSRLRSIVRELSILVEPQEHVGVASLDASNGQSHFDPV